MSDVTSVSPATLQSVGKGSSTLLPKAVSDPPLTVHGKPQVLFIGAEFCPYCAAQRWPLIQALSRFGTFHGLQQISSSSSDVDPNTPTFTFYKSHYTSKYVAFTPVEAEDRAQKTLEKPTKAQATIWVKHSGNPPGFPFLDFGGQVRPDQPELRPRDPGRQDTVADRQPAQRPHDSDLPGDRRRGERSDGRDLHADEQPAEQCVPLAGDHQPAE